MKIGILVGREGTFPQALIMDRISHEVPFYRAYLKECGARGRQSRKQPVLVERRR